jgi:flagellar biosynthetic protein FliR
MIEMMPLLQTLLNLPLLALVLARMSGLVIFAPFFSSGSIPINVRAFLAANLTIIVLPFATLNMVVPSDLSSLVVAITGELLIGMTVGMMTTTLFSGLELSGMLIGQQMGISVAQVFDPLFNENSSALGQLYFWLAMVVFLLIRGHIVLIGALAKSFQTLPIGKFIVSEEVVSSLIQILQMSFILALHIFAPLLVAIFLTTLAMGFVSRTVPQLNILSIGFPLRIAFGFVLLVLCLPPVVQVFLNMLDKTMMKVYEVLNF